jgi:hypothetical protein
MMPMNDTFEIRKFIKKNQNRVKGLTARLLGEI